MHWREHIPNSNVQRNEILSQHLKRFCQKHFQRFVTTLLPPPMVWVNRRKGEKVAEDWSWHGVCCQKWAITHWRHQEKVDFSYFSNSMLMMFTRFPDNQSSKCQVKTFVNLHIDVAAGARTLRRHLHQRQLIWWLMPMLINILRSLELPNLNEESGAYR